MLRDLTFADGPALLDLVGRPEAAAWLQGDGTALFLADVENFILGSLIAEGDRHWAICGKDASFLGLVSLKNIANGRAEFSIGLLPEARGQGHADRAVAKLLPQVFGSLNLDSIYMYTSFVNQPTLAFNYRQGFRLLAGPPPGVPAPARPEETRWFGLTREQYLEGRVKP